MSRTGTRSNHRHSSTGPEPPPVRCNLLRTSGARQGRPAVELGSANTSASPAFNLFQLRHPRRTPGSRLGATLGASTTGPTARSRSLQTPGQNPPTFRMATTRRSRAQERFGPPVVQGAHENPVWRRSKSGSVPTGGGQPSSACWNPPRICPTVRSANPRRKPAITPFTKRRLSARSGPVSQHRDSSRLPRSGAPPKGRRVRPGGSPRRRSAPQRRGHDAGTAPGRGVMSPAVGNRSGGAVVDHPRSPGPAVAGVDARSRRRGARRLVREHHLRPRESGMWPQALLRPARACYFRYSTAPLVGRSWRGRSHPLDGAVTTLVPTGRAPGGSPRRPLPREGSPA